MNSIERIIKVVGFNQADRVPVIAQVFGHAAVVANVPLDEYLQDGGLVARCQIDAWEQYDYDSVFALLDVCVETEALGSRLEFRKDVYPLIKKYAMADTSEIDSFSIPNPKKAGRMPELLKAAKILRNTLGKEVLVVGCALGPMTLTLQLLGAERALYLAIDDPDTFSGLLDFSVEVCVKFSVEQIKAGVHLPVIFEPAASPAVIPAPFFREFLLPRLQKIFRELKNVGSLATWLHIAGPTTPILPYYNDLGADIINIDYYIDPSEAQNKCPNLCINGNIKPLSFITEKPSDIKTMSKTLLGLFKKRGGYILSSGCELPLESKPENIKAMVLSVRE